MKYAARKLGFLRGLLALSVSLAVMASSQGFALAFFNNALSQQQAQLDRGDELLFAKATVTESGVRLEWTSRPDSDNLGFNIYRVQDGQRTRLNREIVPGSLFVAGANVTAEAIPLRSHSFGWFDARGTAESVYYIESVSLARAPRFHEPLTPGLENTPGKKHSPRLNQAPQTSTTAAIADSADNSYREVGYPVGGSAAATQHMLASTLEEQWAVAAQTGVKIGVKKQGWYRVTQPQMAAVGFNPGVDIRNLQLFVDGLEVAINTSQSSGPFGPSDYIEFFGTGVDVPSSDVRTYYLIAGAAPGKRVRGEMQVDSGPVTPTPQPSPTASPANGPVPKSPWSAWRLGGPVANAAQTALPDSLSPWEREGRGLYSRPQTLPLFPLPTGKGMKEMSAGNAPTTALRAPKAPKKKRGKNRVRRKPAEPKREYSHAVVAASIAPISFLYSVERKDRTVYFSSLLNGDAENWFGQVISSPSAPSTQTINTPNPALSAVGPARLEISLQGANHVSHQVSVKFNETVVGNFNFFGLANPVLTFDVPISLLQNGANTLKFTPAGSGDISIVDYARITYPHAFRADSDTLKFSLLGTQTVQVDGFSSPDVKLIDYSDPFNIGLIKPDAAPNAGGSGSAVVIPTSNPKSKTPRLLYATAAPPEQPAAISLNQPSTLNFNTNTADLLIITSAALRASLAPLVAAREAQGMNVDVVDVEDVYDEFGFGLHGPQAVKDFLARANSQWAIKPKYLILAGDASLDPRGYTRSRFESCEPSTTIANSPSSTSETIDSDFRSDAGVSHRTIFIDTLPLWGSP